MSAMGEVLTSPSVGSDLQLSTAATFGSTIVESDQQLSTVATFGSKTTITEDNIHKPLQPHPYVKGRLLSDQDTDNSSVGGEESDAFDDCESFQSSSTGSSDDDEDDDEDYETSSYYSNASTLTSMPSLAVIPKGRMARYAPSQFHSLTGSNHPNHHENTLHRQPQQEYDTKSSPFTKANKSTTKSSSPPLSLYSSRPASKSRHVPSVAVAPLTTTTKSPIVAAVVRPVTPLPPLVRPAVAIRRKPSPPTIGGNTTRATVNTINHRSWWEMPLDSLLGYPSLPSNTRVWDPLMYEEKETDDDDDDDVRFFHKTREEGSI